jgi:hypothetical protein
MGLSLALEGDEVMAFAPLATMKSLVVGLMIELVRFAV